ncbi:MAG: hypothetical protein ACTSU6_03165 [Candidatus Njordarchaeales archaeon]
MQSLFITEEDVFDIKIFVAEDKNGVIYCDLVKSGVEFLLGEKQLEIECYTITFKKPSFGDMIQLTEILLSSRVYDSEVINYQVNPIDARLKTMSCLIKKWDFMDGSGNTIEPTEENLRKLNPTVATAISLQLEDYLKVEEETKEAIVNKGIST